MSAKPRSESRKKPGPRLSRAVGVVRDEVRIGRRNWTLFGVALGVIVVGYIMLSQGSITFAPLFLVAGYCVILPWAILAQEGPEKAGDAPESPREGNKA